MSKLIEDFYYSEAPPNESGERHKHNVYQMLYVTRGRVSLEIAGRRFDCSADTLVFIGNCEPHIILSSSSDYSRYVLTLDPYVTDGSLYPKYLKTVFSFHPTGFSNAVNVKPISAELRVLVEMLFREWCEARGSDGEALILSALLYRLKSHSPSHFEVKAFGSAELIVASVRAELENNFAKKLELDALAEKHHVSRYYLAHIFRRVSGHSLKEYLMLCRISYSCQLLTEGEMSVGEIADAAGFGDVSNFSRSFKERMSVTPSEYRARSRGKRLL